MSHTKILINNSPNQKMAEQLKTFWDISRLKENENNPRTITKQGFENLKYQIQKLGQYKPLLIKEDGTILGGNMRYKAYQALGIKEIWVSIINPKNADEELEYVLSDNDRAGKYEADLIANLDLSGIDIHKFSIDLKDPTLLSQLVDQYKEPEEDDVPTDGLPEIPVSQLGEIYQLGDHRLMCGDSTDPTQVAQLMGGVKADMVFTDPPYNIGYIGGDGKRRDKILNDKMTNANFYQFLFKAITNMLKNTDGCIYICMSPKELPNLKNAFEEAGGHWQSFLIWVKNHFTLGGADYQNQYEPILYGWRADIKHHFFIDERNNGNVIYEIGNRAKINDNGDTEIKIGNTTLVLEGKVKGHILKSKAKTDIWQYDKPTKSDDHPTMKPVALVVEAIKNSSMPKARILDLFLGSGTTLIASEQLGRQCYGMEMDPHYCDIIRKRYAKFINKEEEWQTITPKI